MSIIIIIIHQNMHTPIQSVRGVKEIERSPIPRRTITGLHTFQDNIIAVVSSRAWGGKNAAPTLEDLRNVELPEDVVRGLDALRRNGSNAGGGKSSQGKTLPMGMDPSAVLVSFLTRGGAVAKISAAAVVANLAKLQELKDVGTHTIALLIPMIDGPRPDLLRLVALVALHVLSTWRCTHKHMADTGAFRRLGRILNGSRGLIGVMTKERAMLTLLQLINDEKLRRQAFQLGLGDMVVDQLTEAEIMMR